MHMAPSPARSVTMPPNETTATITSRIASPITSRASSGSICSPSEVEPHHVDGYRRHDPSLFPLMISLPVPQMSDATRSSWLGA